MPTSTAGMPRNSFKGTPIKFVRGECFPAPLDTPRYARHSGRTGNVSNHSFGLNRRSLNRERGFTYAMVLVAMVLVGIFAGVANIATSRMVQADREEELMFRGTAYRNAIQRYYAVAGRYPRSLDELLKDPRFVSRPYLRTPYPDPMADKGGEIKENDTWRLVRAADGGIAGVASRSGQEPMKKANFPPGFEKFDDAKNYAEWIFVYEPRPIGATKAAGGSLLGGAVSK